MGPIKNLEKVQKEKQKHNDKSHCNNANNINTFPSNIVCMFIVWCAVIKIFVAFYCPL